MALLEAGHSPNYRVHWIKSLVCRDQGCVIQDDVRVSAQAACLECPRLLSEKRACNGSSQFSRRRRVKFLGVQ